jgi:diaminopimelate decarboxylase
MNAQALLSRYGSPAYVYDLACVRRAHSALAGELPQNSVLYYSLKANPHPALVAELARLGCRAEVSSTGEMTTALSCEMEPRRCLYTGPGKTSREIAFAIEKGGVHFSVDSPHDLRKVAAAAQQAQRRIKLLLRINPETPPGATGLTMGGAPSQFGADADWVRRCPGEFQGTEWARIVGFHIYAGTNISPKTALLGTFEAALNLAIEAAGLLRIELETIDLGGGFGHPFAVKGEPHDISGLRDFLEPLLDNHFAGWREGRPQIAFESGRYLVASSGTLLCTVEDVKASKGRFFVVLDSGINHLGGMAGLRRVPSVNPQLTRLGEDSIDRVLQNADIVGPLCTPVDYLARGVDLPSLNPGEIVAIPNVGAYGLTGSLLAFLSREAPVEIVLDGEDVVSASQIVARRYDR